MVAVDSATRWFTEVGDVFSESCQHSRQLPCDSEMPTTRSGDGSLFKNLTYSQHGDGPTHNSSQGSSKQRSVIVWDDHRDMQNKNSYHRRARCDQEMAEEHQYWPAVYQGTSQPQHGISDYWSEHHSISQADDWQQQQQQPQPHSVIHRAMPQSHHQTIVDQHHPHHPAMSQLSALERESRSSYEAENDVLLQCNNSSVSMLRDVFQSQQQCVLVPVYQDVPLSEQNMSAVVFQTDDTEASQKQRIVTDSMYQLAASNEPRSTNVGGLNSRVMTTSRVLTGSMCYVYRTSWLLLHGHVMKYLLTNSVCWSTGCCHLYHNF